MPVDSGWALRWFDNGRPTVNNNGEVAFGASLTDAAGKVAYGAFFLAQDGGVQTVALPGQDLPGGQKVVGATAANLNDTGTVAFLASTEPNSQNGAYLWEKGTVTAVAPVGTEIPGLGKIAAVDDVSVNSKTRTVLLLARLNLSGPAGLYFWANGTITPVVAKGQDTPEGGKIQALQWPISLPNEAGQYAFLATVADAGVTEMRAYLLDANGKLSLVFRPGTTTDLGTITRIGGPTDSTQSWGVSVNSQGQAALPVRIDNGPPTLVLLTPASP